MCWDELIIIADLQAKKRIDLSDIHINQIFYCSSSFKKAKFDVHDINLGVWIVCVCVLGRGLH